LPAQKFSAAFMAKFYIKRHYTKTLFLCPSPLSALCFLIGIKLIRSSALTFMVLGGINYMQSLLIKADNKSLGKWDIDFEAFNFKFVYFKMCADYFTRSKWNISERKFF
jgi:hypothetical protein